MTNIIIDLQNSDTWKNQLTILIYFISLKNAKEEYLLYMENIKKSYKNNKFEIYTPTRNEEVELPD